ncbi:ATP-grasp domain-containing protein [Leifsonia sp. Le1]|uniref:ATP-grasp domain-containing protein n=1 Tax=Leifsonia sp. Le1 TaxID=3404918 RepID=UPI003EBB73D1
MIGQVPKEFREYALDEASKVARLVLVTNLPADWHRTYCEEVLEIDLDAPDARSKIARHLSDAVDGVYTLDERYVELTAHLVDDLGLPGAGRNSISRFKDKAALREMTHRRDYSLEFGVAYTVEQALDVASEIGYPVVLKPRALGGSIGVVRVEDDDQLRRAFHVAHRAKVGTIASAYQGVLVEEFAVGPGISVNSYVHEGNTTMCFVSDRLVGLEPYFEELGHNVGPITDDISDKIGGIVEDIHCLSEFDGGVSNIEFVLTDAGPKLIEVNARLSGDLIPYLGLRATQINLARTAAHLALGLAPDEIRSTAGAAAIRFIYPQRRIVFDGIEWPPLDRHTEDFDILISEIADKGTSIAPPPEEFMARLAYAIVVGKDKDEVVSAVDWIVENVIVREPGE